MQVDYFSNMVYMKQRTKIREFQYKVKGAQKTQLTCSVSIGGEGSTTSAFSMQQSTEGMFAGVVLFKSDSAQQNVLHQQGAHTSSSLWD